MNAGQILDFVLENKDAKDDKLIKLVEDFMSSHKPYYHEKTKVTDACSICSFEDVESCLDKASKSTFIKDNTFFSFDWLVENDTNIIKVYEDRYKDKEVVYGY